MFYELAYIIPATLENENQESVKTKINSLIKEEGGHVIIEPPAEKRKLAYQVKRTRQGIFQFIRFSSNEDKMDGISRGIRLMPEILRSQVVRLKATSPADAAKSAAMPKITPTIHTGSMGDQKSLTQELPETTPQKTGETTPLVSTLEASQETLAEPASADETKQKNTVAKKPKLSLDDLNKKIDQILEGNLDQL